MNVLIAGGGPAGLYLGILLAKADAGHKITVVERNAPDATFGWGVVFSEETLGALRDADFPTFLEITDSFARWDTVDIRGRGRPIRSRGHAFSAIARTRLLNILQRRCRELAVGLRFGEEVDEHVLDSGADLVVGADGVHSVLRDTHADVFGTSIRPQGCRYAWFGTDIALDAFTFAFRDTEYGLFQAHAYPFDENTSTFIVECPDPVWRAAGLDRMNERESIEFCQALFAEDLAGHRLLSNRSVWTSFPLVRNAGWHHGNLVLLGDAAHTAHFSIGSGTKLAMEDAIALANSLVRHGHSTPERIEAALVDYELTRQPVVERFQQAAGESAEYFERVADHSDLAPLQFAFNLLTRSGRISHANLTLRDPGFVMALDAWFDGKARQDRPAPVAAPPMFAPLRIGGLAVRNRFVREVDVTRLEVDCLEETVTGAGLALAATVAVTKQGRISSNCPTLHDDAQIERWTRIADVVHGAEAKLALRLGHAGRRGSTRPRRWGADIPLRSGGWPLVAASAVPYGPFSPVPVALTGDDMAAIRQSFVEAAGRAAAAGVDVLELDMAHGYLLAGFLSPLSNLREDDYGGTPQRRLRYPLEVLRAVREVWPTDRVLAVRLTVTDWTRHGLEVADGVEIARALAEEGAELVHVAAGQTCQEHQPRYRREYLTTLSECVRNQAGVRTLVGGYLTTSDEVNTIVGAGRADLCLLEANGIEAVA